MSSSCEPAWKICAPPCRSTRRRTRSASPSSTRRSQRASPPHPFAFALRAMGNARCRASGVQGAAQRPWSRRQRGIGLDGLLAAGKKSILQALAEQDELRRSAQRSQGRRAQRPGTGRAAPKVVNNLKQSRVQSADLDTSIAGVDPKDDERDDHGLLYRRWELHCPSRGVALQGSVAGRELIPSVGMSRLRTAPARRPVSQHSLVSSVPYDERKRTVRRYEDSKARYARARRRTAPPYRASSAAKVARGSPPPALPARGCLGWAG